ncbi:MULTISPECIES: LysR family transcriptional regulator [unclassified Streptomyces]|uniref:LysR family transcriptional regulator n=1 Tax=unclassified Streptomyces TaxID=2593676 RepID=UPI002DD86E53|nr:MULTISPECIES: LysR family transcriptional regulator [unclassified Streptomyces]WSA95184.1 LysR family transcriptional regulator [Streptomyces sp. NBC_01795]WSB79603.1 LysR family transcriptional regulator [Streptomyces sp. NBC_01775]WSS12194.1 LysR family transcriptional regulator [Streptomyces sp. NBC_01186]WSS40906.1 LysR family transcriptional regulator [Streptomyces sp. NBC_01187]
MELKQLETFLVVARHLHFTRAARELGYVQSSVTAHVKALENELGVALFERLGRRVVLTGPGRELCTHARTLLGRAEQAAEAVRGAGEDPARIRGTLRLAAPESLCAHHLPPVLGAVRERFPLLRLAFQPAARGPLLDALAEGTIDAGFLQEEAVSAPGVHAERMRREPLRLVAHPRHPLAARRRVATGELARETVLLLEPGCAQRLVMDRELSRAGLRPPTVEFFSVEALRRCAAAGLGVGLAPAASVDEEIARGELAALAWECEPVLDVFFVRHEGRQPAPAVRELAALARQHWAPCPA